MTFVAVARAYCGGAGGARKGSAGDKPPYPPGLILKFFHPALALRVHPHPQAQLPRTFAHPHPRAERSRNHLSTQIVDSFIKPTAAMFALSEESKACHSVTEDGTDLD